MSDDGATGDDPFQTILLATDGSEFSAGTERVGVAMAERHGSRLHVLRLLTAASGSAEGLVEEQEAGLHMERIDAVCNARSISCTPMVRMGSGDPSQGILAAAREVGAQLVVIGRRGGRRLARLMVGDATSKVVDKAECSVLVVPRLVSFWSSGILLALDPDQAESDTAARASYRLAQAAGLPLTVLLAPEEEEKGSDRWDANQIVNRLVAMAKLQEVAAEGMVQAGDLDEVTLEVARQRSADLIVCEPRDRSVVERLFNANTLVTLIGQAHCPVMVVR